ncbi:hypothetical protein GFY24_17745 [Nocardia sp. SYP-A9097]|uniref:hypothetical protein n=1 Tax=Nocardia sp. SYP-A9097 TaxID=2663237 RepID=UPI00129AB396|nr:hypothetical protein [Nocardia sp. SYP-A9097]MRH89269.1 hypothetical protein [Nocardia sp. SYP-A9097]
MVRSAVAADPDEPDSPASAQRPHLEVVPGEPAAEPPHLADAQPPPPLGENPLAAADIARLPAAARHRIAAFIHLQIAALEEMPDPLPDNEPNP